MTTPRNLQELRSVKDAAMRATAAKHYIEEREDALAEARAIRDAAIRSLIDRHGVTATARMCEVSISHVKLVRKS